MFEPGKQSTRFPNAPAGYLLAGDPGCPARGFSIPISVSGRLDSALPIAWASARSFGVDSACWNPLWTEQYNTDVDSAPFSDQVTLYGVGFSNPYAGVANPFPQSYAPFTPPRMFTFSFHWGNSVFFLKVGGLAIRRVSTLPSNASLCGIRPCARAIWEMRQASLLCRGCELRPIHAGGYGCEYAAAATVC